jgi:hypothetical protein
MAFAAFPDVPAALADPACAVPPSDQTAIFAFDGAMIFDLNLVAAFVWDLLDGRRSIDELASRVRAQFGPSVPDARRDVAQLLEALEQKELVCPAAPAAPAASD